MPWHAMLTLVAHGSIFMLMLMLQQCKNVHLASRTRWSLGLIFTMLTFGMVWHDTKKWCRARRSKAKRELSLGLSWIVLDCLPDVAVWWRLVVVVCSFEPGTQTRKYKKRELLSTKMMKLRLPCVYDFELSYPSCVFAKFERGQ